MIGFISQQSNCKTPKNRASQTKPGLLQDSIIIILCIYYTSIRFILYIYNQMPSWKKVEFGKVDLGVPNAEAS
jgi:hypothetical protein